MSPGCDKLHNNIELERILERQERRRGKGKKAREKENQVKGKNR